ncbi:MAG: SMI1/KNR4 family protein [Pyrinomonadaceae bacterium]
MIDKDIYGEVLHVVEKWTQLGERHCANGTKLICPTPHVAPKAYLHLLYAPLCSESICELENEFELPLPESFRSLLGHSNGLDLFSGFLSIWGVRISWARVGDDGWQPYDLIYHNRDLGAPQPECAPPVVYFGSSANGENWCFFEQLGQTYRVGETPRHEFAPIRYWPNFETWFREKVAEIEVLFDEEGRQIAPIGMTSIN